MAVAFGDLLYDLLPGVYRDKDAHGELRSFVEIMAVPLTEIEQSIAQLHDDHFIATCRPEFVAAIGALVGVTLDAATSDAAQRAEVRNAVASYREKGLLATLERFAEDVTGWRVHVVDLTDRVAQTAFVEAPGTSVRPATLNVADVTSLTRLDRVDDRAVYTVDARSPRHTSHSVGRAHPDNVGFFFVPARVLVNQRPNQLPGPNAGRFTFDGGPLEGSDDGVSLQLLDGLDGIPITRQLLQGREHEFCGTRRGFTIRVDGVSITDPDFAPTLQLVTANLEDFDTPIDLNGDLLVLTVDDVAIDPQLGRFINSGILATAAEHVRVDYQLAAAERVERSSPFRLGPSNSSLFSFSHDGATVALRDALDGTLIAESLQLGAPSARYHGTTRGWEIFTKVGDEVSGPLDLDVRDLAIDDDEPVPVGRIAVDPTRGRFKLAPGFIEEGELLEASFWCEPEASRARVIRSLLDRLARAVPAGVVPVLVDARAESTNQAHLIES
jgi:phage tail-like protein